MARNTSRIGKALGGLGALLVAIAATGCAAPQFTYVADGAASTYFKVPNNWHKISDASLAAQFNSPGSSGQGAGLWDVAYDGSAVPEAKHLFSATATQPFAFAFVAPLSAAGSNAMSYNALRDLVWPVTPAARQAAAQNKSFPLTGFRLLRDTVLTSSQGVHGVWVTYEYTYPGGITDTFDQVALTNADSTQLYALEMHCLASCYSRNQNEFNTILSSFTVRSP